MIETGTIFLSPHWQFMAVCKPFPILWIVPLKAQFTKEILLPAAWAYVIAPEFPMKQQSLRVVFVF
jgi:hypothetical protein